MVFIGCKFNHPNCSNGSELNAGKYSRWVCQTSDTQICVRQFVEFLCCRLSNVRTKDSTVRQNQKLMCPSSQPVGRPKLEWPSESIVRNFVVNCQTSESIIRQNQWSILLWLHPVGRPNLNLAFDSIVRQIPDWNFEIKPVLLHSDLKED